MGSTSSFTPRIPPHVRATLVNMLQDVGDLDQQPVTPEDMESLAGCIFDEDSLYGLEHLETDLGSVVDSSTAYPRDRSIEETAHTGSLSDDMMMSNDVGLLAAATQLPFPGLEPTCSLTATASMCRPDYRATPPPCDRQQSLQPSSPTKSSKKGKKNTSPDVISCRPGRPIKGNKKTQNKTTTTKTKNNLPQKSTKLKRRIGCGLRGVSPQGAHGWKAEISIAANRIHLGSFASAQDAYEAYLAEQQVKRCRNLNAAVS